MAQSNKNLKDAMASILVILSENLTEEDMDSIYVQVKKIASKKVVNKKKVELEEKPAPEPKDEEDIISEKDIKKIKKIIMDEDDTSKHIGFCASCGDGVIAPFVFTINSNNKRIRLPVQLCHKCRTVYTHYDLFSGFLETVISSMGGSITSREKQ